MMNSIRFGRYQSLLPGVVLAITAAFVLLAPQIASPAAAGQTVTGNPETITAAIPKSWPPHYIVEDGADPTGFGVEILNAVATRAGYRVSYRVMPTFKEAMDALYRGDVDVIPNVGIVPSRAEKLNFTDPVETFIVSLFLRADSQGVADIADLENRRVGVVVHNIGAKIMADYPKLEAVVFDDIREALFDLLAGRIDGLIYPATVVELLTREIGIAERIKRAGPPLREIKRGIAVHPAQAEVHRRLSVVTRTFIKTDEYRAIYSKWFATPSSDWPLRKVMTVGGAGLAILIFIFTGWHYFTVMRMNRALEERVALRTRELHDAQEDLVRSERLATLGQLTGTMAHELRNPLGGVVLAFEIIKRKAKDPSYDLTDSLNRAARGIERCGKIIDELLDYAQIRRPVRASVDADRLIAEVLDDSPISPLITVRRDLGAPGLTIQGDAEQLRQVLINLLDNARDAIGERDAEEPGFAPGELTVSTRPVESGLEIVISDDGAGVEPDQLDRIFEPLFSTKSFGVGLGLPNAQNIVLAHGGEITLDSKHGSGTKVRIWLPLADPMPGDEDAG